MTSVIPTFCSASESGSAAKPPRPSATASKPRFMLRPWSPSPIAWSSSVNSSAWSRIVATPASTIGPVISGAMADLPAVIHAAPGVVEEQRRTRQRRDRRLLMRRQPMIRPDQNMHALPPDLRKDHGLGAERLDREQAGLDA